MYALLKAPDIGDSDQSVFSKPKEGIKGYMPSEHFSTAAYPSILRENRAVLNLTKKHDIVI